VRNRQPQIVREKIFSTTKVLLADATLRRNCACENRVRSAKELLVLCEQFLFGARGLFLYRARHQ